MIGPFIVIDIYYGWCYEAGVFSVQMVGGSYTRCEKPIKVTATFSLCENHYVEKQAQKHCRVMLGLVHIIFCLSMTLLGKYLILVYNRVVEVIELLGGQ